MKKLLTFLMMFILAISVGWAETETFQYTGNKQAVKTQNGITVTLAKANGSTDPATNTYSGENGRLYKDNTLTVDAGSNTITEVKIFYTGTGYTIRTSSTDYYELSSGTYSLDNTTGTWSGNASTVTITNKDRTTRFTKITVTYTTGGSSPTTVEAPIFSGVTNGATATEDVALSMTTATDGATIYYDTYSEVLNSIGISDLNKTYNNSAVNFIENGKYYVYAAAYKSGTWSSISSITFTVDKPATPSTTQWELVDPANLVTGDVVLIVDKYSSRAMSNDKGTDAAPSATSVTLNSDKSQVTDGVTAALQWTVTNTNGTYNFTVPGGTTYLYCTNTNNGLRVGTGTNNDFIIYDNNGTPFLKNEMGTSEDRYIGVYSNQDWRCYKSIGDNIASTVVAFYKKVELGAHSVAVASGIEHGSVSVSPSSANADDNITVTVSNIDAGYELTGLSYNGTAIDISSTPYTFAMPDEDVTVTATFSKIDYTITKGSMTNGTVNVAATANYGDVVTITPVPETDYVVDKVYYNDGTDHEIAVNNNAYTFTMPASNVIVWATFVEYYPTLRLAGRFNGRSTSSWITDNSGPEFTYDTSTEKYTIDAYFIGASQDEGSDVDFFYLRSDNDDLKANASGNCWVGANGGTYSLGGSSNFRIYPGVYNITVNKARTSITFTKITPVLTFSPNGGEVEAGQTVTVTSNLQTLVDNIKNTYDSGATGTVNHSVSTDQNNWDDNVTLNTIGSATVYGRAVLGNIYATGNAAFTVVAANTSNQYQLVTDINAMVSGKKYLIVSAGSYTASQVNYNFEVAATSVGDNNLLGGADVTIDDDNIITLDATTSVVPYIMEKADGKWSFKSSSTNEYLTFTDPSSGSGKVSTDATNGTAFTLTSINSSTGVAVLSLTNTTLQFNPNSAAGDQSKYRFTTYKSSLKPVMLFKQVEGTVTQKSAAPVITPEGGNIVGYSQEVEITQANGGTIYYTTDGTTPTESSAQYTGKFWAEGANLGDEVTITAVAKEDGKELSNPVSVTYKFVAPVAPVFTPGAGTYTTPQTVTVSSTTEGADVYYTATSGLSAAQIVAQGTKFEEPFTVSTPTTYYAVTVYHDAHANRDALSGIRQAQYKFSEVESVDLPYSHPFTGGTEFGEFTTLDVNNPDEITVWTVSDDFGAKGTSFTSKPNTNHAATSWLLSPYINLGDAEEPVLTFKHQINKFFANPSTQATVWIKSYGGEWAQLTTGLPENSNGIGNGEWPSFDEEYDLSAYKGQIVQIGFKYDNPTAGSGAGTWEIQNFLVADNAPIEVENIAEYLALPIGTNNITFKNPVTVQYHYISDSGKSYIYVKDDSGCAYFHQPAVDGETAIAQLDNGDIIAGGFSGNKVPDEMVGEGESNFAMFTDLENFAPNGDKGLADPEHETVAHIADATMGVALNNHYITIKKVKLSALYQPTDITYGGEKYFDIDNVAHIGYNKFNIDYSVVDDVNAYYDITGIFTAYNNTLEFHPTEIVKWEEAVVTLRQLCQDGEVNKSYTISNNLLAVYANDNVLWLKDDTGQSIQMTKPADGELNYPINDGENTRKNQAYYDQSNWLQVEFAAGFEAERFVDKIIKGGAIKGKFTDKVNPTLTGATALTDENIYAAGSYANNFYCMANFAAWPAGADHLYQTAAAGVSAGSNFFFMNPKPQEYATITYAVWMGDDTFVIPEANGGQNGNDFNGAITVAWDYNEGASASDLDNAGVGNQVYKFNAIIKKAAAASGAPRRVDVAGKGGQSASGYVVYPTNLTASTDGSIITAVDELQSGKAVDGVRYVNVAGQVAATPWQGVNIVVTRYTDGSTRTTKVVK